MYSEGRARSRRSTGCSLHRGRSDRRSNDADPVQSASVGPVSEEPRLSTTARGRPFDPTRAVPTESGFLGRPGFGHVGGDLLTPMKGATLSTPDEVRPSRCLPSQMATGDPESNCRTGMHVTGHGASYSDIMNLRTRTRACIELWTPDLTDP